jgi:hypothetical protein
MVKKLIIPRLGIATAVAVILQLTASFAIAQSLDFETYRTKVEPIFYKQREGHARCVVCHAQSNNSFKLQEWGPKTKAYTEEQSRLNYQMILQIVTPGNPDGSLLLMHPLAKTGGGDEFHSGGRQFESKNDPDWKTIAAWVKGVKAAK